ncbi:MAG: hypothetical protein R6V03_05450 [Kiritimatiellia bacterium]
MIITGEVCRKVIFLSNVRRKRIVGGEGKRGEKQKAESRKLREERLKQKAES